MIQKSIMLAEITPSELQQIIAGVVREAVSKELQSITLQTNSPTKETDTYLTRKEVCELFKISLPTLNTYTKVGIIKAKRLGRSVRYRRKDIEAALEDVRSQKHKKLF
jgi:excisionase family DNA binding protein